MQGRNGSAENLFYRVETTVGHIAGTSAPSALHIQCDALDGAFVEWHNRESWLPRNRGKARQDFLLCSSINPKSRFKHEKPATLRARGYRSRLVKNQRELRALILAPAHEADWRGQVPELTWVCV